MSKQHNFIHIGDLQVGLIPFELNRISISKLEFSLSSFIKVHTQYARTSSFVFKEACRITNGGGDDEDRNNVKGMVLCDEMYVVGEGETLNTMGDKCCDPFIVEHNPRTHVPDDVFPGFVLKISPPNSRNSFS